MMFDFVWRSYKEMLNNVLKSKDGNVIAENSILVTPELIDEIDDLRSRINDALGVCARVREAARVGGNTRKEICVMNTDQPLIAQIGEGQLVIRIGIERLARRFEYDEDSRFRGQKITDPEQLCKDICEAMCREDDTGYTPLMEFLDDMQDAAVENGSSAMGKSKGRVRYD